MKDLMHECTLDLLFADRSCRPSYHPAWYKRPRTLERSQQGSQALKDLVHGCTPDSCSADGCSGVAGNSAMQHGTSHLVILTPSICVSSQPHSVCCSRLCLFPGTARPNIWCRGPELCSCAKYHPVQRLAVSVNSSPVFNWLPVDSNDVRCTDRIQVLVLRLLEISGDLVVGFPGRCWPVLWNLFEDVARYVTEKIDGRRCNHVFMSICL